MPKPHILSFSLIVASLGCQAPIDDLGESEQAVLTENGLSANGLSLNGLSLNGLSLNGLSLNGLSLNGLSLNGLSLNGLSLDAEQVENARTLFHYLTGCALEAQQTVTIDGELFNGALGLAPTWEDGSLDLRGQEDVSACLLAHTNSQGKHVAISLSSPQLATSALEIRSYPRRDGAFWGNLFAPNARAVACFGDSDNRPLGRDCAVPASGGTTICGFESAGFCDDVCSYRSKQRYYTRCESQGPQAITVFTWKETCADGACDG